MPLHSTIHFNYYTYYMLTGAAAIDKPKPKKLKKVLGVVFGIAVVVGGTIGVGILRTPGTIAGLLPNPQLILLCWVLIGLYILLSAASYAELTTMLPKAGGAYNYIKRAYGNYAGFINGWFDFFSNAIAPAYFCIVLGEYCALLYAPLQGQEKIVAVAFLSLFTLINLPGVKSGSITQQITSAIKIVLFLVLIVGCFFTSPSEANTIQKPLLQGGLFIAFFKVIQLIMGAYDGWMSVAGFAEEDSDPGKNIPKSYFFGAIAVTMLYILINAAVLYVLPVSAIAQSPLAASDAATVAFGKGGAVVMTLVSVFSLISILNAYMMIPSRILFGLSRDGFFVRKGMKVNNGGTPYFSLLFCYALAALLIIYSSFEELFALGVFMMTIVTGCTYASLMRLRKKEPQLPRPYKAWGYPWSTIIAIIITIGMFIGFAMSDQKSLVIILVIVVVSFPLYKLLEKMNKS